MFPFLRIITQKQQDKKPLSILTKQNFVLQYLIWNTDNIVFTATKKSPPAAASTLYKTRWVDYWNPKIFVAPNATIISANTLMRRLPRHLTRLSVA